MKMLYKQYYNKAGEKIGYRTDLTGEFEVKATNLRVGLNQSYALSLDLKWEKEKGNSVEDSKYYIPDFGYLTLEEMFKNECIVANIWVLINFETFSDEADILESTQKYFRITSLKMREFLNYVDVTLELVDDFNYIMGRLYTRTTLTGTIAPETFVYNTIKNISNTKNRTMRYYNTFIGDAVLDTKRVVVEDFKNKSYKECINEIIEDCDAYVDDVIIDDTFSNFLVWLRSNSLNVPDSDNTVEFSLDDSKKFFDLMYVDYELDLSEFATFGNINLKTGDSTTKYNIAGDDSIDGFSKYLFSYDYFEAPTLDDERYTILESATKEVKNTITNSIVEKYELPDVDLTRDILDDAEKLEDYFKLKVNNYIKLNTQDSSIIFKIVEVAGDLETFDVLDLYSRSATVDIITSKKLTVEYVKTIKEGV